MFTVATAVLTLALFCAYRAYYREPDAIETYVIRQNCAAASKLLKPANAADSAFQQEFKKCLADEGLKE